MHIGSKFFMKNEVAKAKLPKHVKVVLRLDIPEKEQHAETVVFDRAVKTGKIMQWIIIIHTKQDSNKRKIA